MSDTIRLDVWLDVACLFKTRSEAKRACEGGKVDVNGQAAKPSRAIRAGDRIHLTMGEWRRELVVTTLSERRGPAAEARALYEDLSPPPPPRAVRPPKAVYRVPGLGRPTKRERRLHDRLRDF